MADTSAHDETRDETRDESTSERKHESDVNSGGGGLKGALAETVGELQEVGAGFVVGAAAYTDGVTNPNPYYQYGTVDTGGYGGPPNIGAVSHVFAKARHDALIFAGQIVDDTTNNAAAYGQGVGSGLAPELVTRTPLTGQAQRDWETANVDAAATYQTGHPVMLHGLSDEVIAAGQEADEFGNPFDVNGGGRDRSEGSGSSDGSDSEYDDHSDRAERSDEQRSTSGQFQSGQGQSRGQSQPPRAAQEPGQAQTRQKVDPTRQQGQQNG